MAHCEAVSRAAIAEGDKEMVAAAALLLPAVRIGSWSLRARQRALAERALRLIGDGGPADTVVALRSVIATMANPWSGDGIELVDTGLPSGDPAAAAGLLRARHEELVHLRHVEARLHLADEMIALGETTGDDELLATGRAWRLDGLSQLGRRADLDAELLDLCGLIDRMDNGWWQWWRLATWASLSHLDGEHGEALAHSDRAAAFGEERSIPEAPFVHLVLQTRVALRTGERLVPVEEAVREVLRHAPMEARGWRAQLLVARGMMDEAADIWRSLAPRLEGVPERAPEWAVVNEGHASLALALGDRASAAVIFRMLSPYEGLHVVGPVQTPSSGPVSLVLGRLAALVGDDSAARHLDAAETQAAAIGAPDFIADARSARHALEERGGVLTPREREVAHAIGSGDTNAQIARRLYVSERTIESHVSHILTKLNLPSRAAVATWVARGDGGRSLPPISRRPNN